MTPIDLQAVFGKRYKLERDPAYVAAYGRRARIRDPWYDVMVCRHGEIFPWGGERLAASTRTNGGVATNLRQLDCCRVEQDGDDGVTVTFHIDDFRQVAAIMKPRRARPASSRQLAALKRGGIQVNGNSTVKSPKSKRQRTRTAGCGS